MRTGIQQFRAALTDHANQTTLMRGYRELAGGPLPMGSRVGVDWGAWPPAVNAVQSDWLQWTREGGQPAATAGWMQWPDGAAATPARGETRLAGWGDWSNPPAAAA